jgi:Ca2+-binding RTX toxin-like protein
VRRVLLGLAVLAATAAAPAAAGAHAIVTVDGDAVRFSSRDAISRNTLTVTTEGSQVRFSDPSVDGGIAPGPCEPGAVDPDGFIREVLCPLRPATRLVIDVADREDSVTVRAAVPAVVLGGPGADVLVASDAATTLDGGVGDDRLTGGAGADVLDGGAGIDVLDGGAGDDEVRARDGVADRVACGGGSDRGLADAVDAVDLDCEAVDGATAPGAPGAPGAPAPVAGPPSPSGEPRPAAADRTAPRLRALGLTLQRVRAAPWLRVLATSSEEAELAASGTVRVGERVLRFGRVTGRVTVGGGGAELRVPMGRATHRALRRALGRRTRLRAVISVVATDAAGNSSATALPAITLAR